MNLATEYLRATNQTIDDYDGLCGELVNDLQKTGNGDDHIIYVEGDIGWRYHMALLRDGLVHDAWCDAGALPPREWLIEMFGERAWIEFTLDGEDLFEGNCRDFQLQEALVQ